MIIDYLPSEDIASLRLTSPAFRQLPIILFRRLLIEDMPWFWEAQEVQVVTRDWYKMYQMVRFRWSHLQGLQNRKRV